MCVSENSLPTIHDFHSNSLSVFSSLTSSVSNLVVTTCHTSQPAGTRIEYDSNGQIKTKNSCAREVRTLHIYWFSTPRHSWYILSIPPDTLSIAQYIPSIFSVYLSIPPGHYQYIPSIFPVYSQYILSILLDTISILPVYSLYILSIPPGHCQYIPSIFSVYSQYISVYFQYISVYSQCMLHTLLSSLCTGWYNCGAAQSLPHPPSETQGISTQLEEGGNGNKAWRKCHMIIVCLPPPLSSLLYSLLPPPLSLFFTPSFLLPSSLFFIPSKGIC